MANMPNLIYRLCLICIILGTFGLRQILGGLVIPLLEKLRVSSVRREDCLEELVHLL